MSNETLQWILFNAFVLAMLGMDLGVFNKAQQALKGKEALVWSGVWIGHALLFAVGIYFWMGPAAGDDFLKAYGIEKSLSLAAVAMLFLLLSLFSADQQQRDKILLWGIIGTVVMRIAANEKNFLK